MVDIKQSLRNFVATSNSGKYATEDEVFAKFPEFDGYDRQLLRNFVATSNSGKYATEEEVFAKFPEFNIDVKKKDQSQTGYDQTQPGSGSKTAPSSNRSFAGSIDYLDQAPKFGEIPGAPKVPGTEGVVPTQKKQPKRTIVRGEEADQAIAESLTPQAAVAESTQPMSLQSKYKNVEKLETTNDKIIETFQSENRTNKFSPKDIEKNYNEYAKNALDDYLDYLNFTDRGGSTYQKTKEQLDYYRSLGDKLFNDEQYADDYKRYLDLQQEAILNVNKQDAKYVNKLKTKYDWDTFNKKTSEVELKLSNIENQIKNISSDGSPLTPLEQKKYDDLLKQYNQIQTDYANFSNELGITEDVINQMSNSASRLAASQKAVNSIENEDTVNSKRLKEYKAQLLSNKKAQEEFYGDKDQAWYEQFGKGILNAGEQLGSSLIKGSISMVGDVPQLLTDAIGFEGYGVTDRLAEAADNINSYVDLVAPQLDDKDFPGFVKASGIIGNGLGSVGTFLLAGGGSTKAAQGILRTSTAKGLQTANRVGTFTAASSISAGQMYDQLIEEGFNPTEASRYALAGGIVMGAAEMIVPEDQLLKNTVRRTFIGALRSKSTLKEASQEALKFVYNRSTDVLKNTLKEGGEEAIGQLAQDFSLQAASSLSGKEVDGLWEVQPYVDNFLAGGGVGGVIELLKFGTRNSKYANKFKESMLLELADNYDDISNKMSQIKPEDFNTIGEKYAKLKNVNNALKDIPGFEDLSHADKSHILALAYNKQVILDSVKQSGLDKSNFEKELTTIEEEIQATLNKPKDAVQKPSTEEVLPRQQGATTETGGQPQGMGPSVQGQEVTQEGETEEQRQERIAKEASAGAAEVVTDLNAPNALAASVFPVVGEVEAQIEKGEFVSDEKSTEAQDKLYELLGDIDAREDLTPEQKQRMSAVIENRIQKIQDYDYRTRTETSTTTQTVAAGTTPKAQKQNERAAIPVRTVAEEGIDVTYDGRPGRVELRDGEYVFVPKKLGAVQARPVVIGEAAQVNAGSKFAGVENPTTGPNNSVANITLPNGSTLSVLNDDLSIDIGLEIAKQEVGAAPQALFDTVFEEVVTENKVEVPYLRETKPAQEQAATTEQISEQKPTNIPPSTQQAPATEEKPAYTGNTTQDRALKDKYKADNLKRRILDQAQRIASALGKNTQVYVHETTEEYNKAIAERLGEDQKESTNGRFLYGDGVSEIHIDLSKANEKTLPHEAVHAVLYKAFGENEKLFQQFKDKLKPLLANSTVAELENFANQETYVRQGVTAEEFLAELGGVMTAAGNRIPKTTLQKITQLLNEFLSKITGGRIAPLSTGEVIDLFNSMAEAFASGKSAEIKSERIIDTSKELQSKSRLGGDFQSDLMSESDLKKLEDEGYLIQNAKIEELDNEVVISMFPDNKMVGDLSYGSYDKDTEVDGVKYKKGDRRIVLQGNGGLHFALKYNKDGTFWASTPKTAKSFINLVNKVFDKYPGKPVKVVVFKSTDFKVLSSRDGMVAAMDILELAVQDGDIPSSTFRNALIQSVEKTKDKDKEGFQLFSGELSDKELHESIRSYFFNSNDATFQDRVKVGKKIIGEVFKSKDNINFKNLSEKLDIPLNAKGRIKVDDATQRLGNVQEEAFMENVPVESAIAYIEIPSKLKLDDETSKPSGKRKHISYPGVMRTEDGQRVKVHMLSERKNWQEILVSVNDGNIRTSEQLEDNTILSDLKHGANFAGARNIPYAPVKINTKLKSKSQQSNLKELSNVEETAKALEAVETNKELDDLYDKISVSKNEEVRVLANMVENIQEKNEKNSILNSPLEEVANKVDNILRQDTYFLYKKEARETKEVAEKYTGEVSKQEAVKDFKDAFFGNPNNWVADALKMRESVRVYIENGGTFKQLLSSVQREFKSDGFTESDAANVIKGKLDSLTEKDFRQQQISEAYHKAKQDGSNPELVEAVEKLISTGLKSKSQVSFKDALDDFNSNPVSVIEFFNPRAEFAWNNKEFDYTNEVIKLDRDNSSKFELDVAVFLDARNGYRLFPETNSILRISNHTANYSNFVNDIDNGFTNIFNVVIGDYENTDYRRFKTDKDQLKEEYPNIKINELRINDGEFLDDSLKKIFEFSKPVLQSKSQVSAIPKATTESKDMMSEFDMAANKTGLAKENSVRRFVEKYGEKGLVAKEINDNFEKIQEQLGITKICNI